ncbi:neuronal pentraxin-2b [Lampris incognitus]|uniref:neuronal pentraxin-2b n=1 Tax=Lampris incognitus TaxID=2546036 RepID=UPI0024B54D9B|nr:neuronal pentraxin-2b [Lampris incognitus]
MGPVRPNKTNSQCKDASKNGEESRDENCFTSKQIKEEPTDTTFNETCHVTKIGDWEFEGLEVTTKAENEPCITECQEKTTKVEAVANNDEVVKLFEAFERRVLLKLETIEANFSNAHRRIMDLLEARQQMTSEEDVGDMLPEPCQTVESLESLCLQIQSDALFKKRIVSMLSRFFGLFCFCALSSRQFTRGQADDGRRFICRAVPADGAGCPVTLLPDVAAGSQEEELRNTVMQLRETILQQKETITKQLGTINELTTKLSLCASASDDRRLDSGGSWGKQKQNTMGDVPRDPNDTIDNLGKTMQGLKDRLENLEQQQMRANSSGASFPSELRDLLQRRLGELEEQLLRKVNNLEEEKSMLSNATAVYRLKTEGTLNALVERISELEKGGGDFKSPEQFKLSLPQRTNYLYGQMTKSLPEMYAFTLCMWIKSSASPGIGTPFSYGVPGQANEIVLIEWGNNPIELLINDKVAQLPLSVRDGRWHHICVAWTTRDGEWEAYQDGEQQGSGDNLAAWHPIKPGGIIILGQEQDVVGGRFDAGQAFVGELSQVNIWDRFLKPSEIQTMANCSAYIPGNVVSWLSSNVEVFGRGAFKRPLEVCQDRLPNA